jgi:two-component system chemotaxis response regulator CheY
MPYLALVVDDSMLVRHAIGRFLEERGFVVRSATNGQEALTILEHARPDIIITDMKMPVMGGSEFITAVRSRPNTSSIPIVVVAARAAGQQEVEERAQFTIFKDIEIEEQLQRALTATVGVD